MLQKAFENIVRNWLTTIPVILVMATVLTIGTGIIDVYTKAQETLKNIEEKFSITVYLKDDADPFEVGKLITALEERTDVIKPITYTSKEAAWKLLSQSFSLDQALLKKYRFSLPASLTITPKKPENTGAIEAFLESQGKNLLLDPLLTKDKQRSVTEQMVNFIKKIKEGSLRTLIIFGLLFTVGGILLFASAIHLAITNRHREISIMKLIGASHKTILTPFIAEGAMLSFGAFLLHLVFLLSLPSARFQGNLLIAEFIIIMLLGVVVSHLTTLYHIRKKSLFS
jgi:cell division transport system permease protein